MNFLISFGITVISFSIAVPLLLGIARFLGLYAIVNERQCNVYVLFSKVLATVDEPGFHFLQPRRVWVALRPCSEASFKHKKRPKPPFYVRKQLLIR